MHSKRVKFAPFGRPTRKGEAPLLAADARAIRQPGNYQATVHEFYLICDDVEALVAEMKKRGIASSRVQDEGSGLLTQLTLPGGGKLGIYQPRHARPEAMNG